MIVSSRRLAQMARKWLSAAATGKKKIASRRGGATMALDPDARTAAGPAGKGRFAVYSSDGQRFEVPLAYLKSDLLGELLRMSEDVFGLTGAGPITLPCDAAFMSSVVSCLRRRSSRDAERALLASMAAPSCSRSLAPCSMLRSNQPLVVCGC